MEKTALGVPAAGPDRLMVQQVGVHVGGHGSGMSERRYAADGITRDLPDEVRIRPSQLFADRGRDLLLVDPIVGRLTRLENQGFDDLAYIVVAGGGGFPGGARAFVHLDDGKRQSPVGGCLTESFRT